jgi:DNA topoisomerase-1
MAETLAPIKIHKSRLKNLVNDPAATAKAVHLVYVNCNDEGITRIKEGKKISYKYKGKTVKDKTQLQRIHSLVLPPAWEDVWICALANGHLQATGKDVRNRKQYRYHPLWNQLRNKTKFYSMLELGKILPAIRKQVKKDLALPGLPVNKVLALVISLMEKTGMRIGNEFYEKLYGSFGLTTLKDKHAIIKGDTVKFTFRGKKGVEHQVTLKSKKLSKIVTQCRDIPGKELFQYIDEEGKRCSIESGMVNDYIKTIAEGEFTAKDLRTWCGSIAALNALKETGPFENEKEAKKKIVEVLDKVSLQLGNTRTVCKKYYVHPSLLEIYEKGNMEKWLGKMDGLKTSGDSDLQAEEKIFMNILESL